MKMRGAWAFQSFFICFLFNAVLAVVLFMMADKILEGFGEWVKPFVRPEAPGLPEDIRSALNSLGVFLAQLRGYLLPALASLISAVSLLLWFFIFLVGLRQIRRAGVQAISKQAKLQEGQSGQDRLEEAKE